MHKSHDGALGKLVDDKGGADGVALDDGATTKYKKHKSFMGGSTTPSSVAMKNKVGKGSLLSGLGKKKTSHFSVIDSGSKKTGSIGNKSVLVAPTTPELRRVSTLSGSVGLGGSKTP